MKESFYIAIALFSIGVLSDLQNINNFKRSYFKTMLLGKGFEQVQSGFEEVEDEVISTFGFINRDHYTDIVTITKDRTRARLYVYDDPSGIFKRIAESDAVPAKEKLRTVKILHSRNTEYPDLLLISEIVDGNGAQTIVRGFTLINKDTFRLEPITGFTTVAFQAGAKTGQEPLFFQLAEQDVIADYWILQKDSGRMVFNFDPQNNDVKSTSWSEFIGPECDKCDPPSTVAQLTIPSVYSSAIADFNGDCRSDLVIESQDAKGNSFLEFYVYSNGKFSLVKAAPFNSNLKAGVAVDLNEDGLPDLIFWDTASSEIVVFFNQFQMPAGQIKLHCLLTSQFVFPFSDLTINTNSKVRFGFKLGTELKYVVDPELYLVPALRFADIDLDGFQDLMITAAGDKSEPLILLSVTCSAEKATELGTEPSFCRMFEPMKKNEESTKQLHGKNAVMSAFFDLGECGKLGIISLEKADSGKLKIGAYINNLDLDYYFLKGLGFGNQHEFQSLNGATFLIQRSTADETAQVFVRTQRANCPFNALCLPFVHFGLAKINNYVEYFQIGLNKAEDWTSYWSPIIPNSQLIVYSSPSANYDWKLNIFINPTSAMTLIFFSTVAVLVIIGAIVIYMHLKEKSLDKKFRMDDINFV